MHDQQFREVDYTLYGPNIKITRGKIQLQVQRIYWYLYHW